MSDETKTEGAGQHDPEDLETEGYKGQLISECLFDVINFQKNQRKTWQISALESKKLSNHKIEAHYNDLI